jgi:hypothetical protein
MFIPVREPSQTALDGFLEREREREREIERD